jgi:hypothetical protein
MPGFKSSLNVVHLRIHHDVEAIASTDGVRLTFSVGIARKNSLFLTRSPKAAAAEVADYAVGKGVLRRAGG